MEMDPRPAIQKVVERNEMYGEPTDYYQYDKDAYDTKVVDTNYMYDDDETGMYEWK